MLSTKDVIEKFEVTRATLHNRKTTKPKLFNYLFNTNIQSKELRDINLLLDTYIKTANTKIFTFKELDYILSLNLNLEDIKQIQDIHLAYINTSTKIKKENDIFTLGIYKKLESLNLIERYIFCEILKDIRVKIQNRKDEKVALIQHYLKEFLEK